MLVVNVTTTAHDPLGRGVAQLVSQANFALAFAGDFASDGARLRTYAGVHGSSIRNLLIETGEGLGGRALLEHRPRYTADYSGTGWITNRYGREVSAEGIVTLLAVPIVVDGSVRALLYAGFREAVQFGTEITRQVARVAQRVAWDYSVQDEVTRRISLLTADGALSGGGDLDSRNELRVRYAELRELAQSVPDPDVKQRIREIGERLIGSTPHRDTSGVPIQRLTPREVDVLALVAMGHRNATIARRLGLTESSVKKYLSVAMVKLGAHSRFDAVLQARLARHIP